MASAPEIRDGRREPEREARPSGPVAGGGLRVVIATANCSLLMGGEAALPYQYFRFLRLRAVDVHLVTCVRNRAELEAAFPADRDRIHYAPDDWVQRALYRLGRRMPDKFYRATLGFLALMALHARQRRLIRELVRDRGIDVVHQPYPVSPAEPSLIYSVGAPVVIGPMNGGMDYPPGFRDQENRWESAAIGLGRRLRDIATRLLPGKREARILLVANRRSRDYLPRSIRGEVLELAENGVDLATWGRPGERGGPGGPARFVYLGRLVGWKGVDLLLKAWASLRPPPSGQLTIIGDGPMRGTLEALRDRLGLTHSVEFAGFLPHAECVRGLADADVLVLPSLIECGGNAVLEAMAMGLPVIATDWGGPADYLDASCGILVPPGSRASFIAGLAEAIARLDRSPELRRAMGQAARRRIAAFSWDAKIESILEIYRRAAGRDERTDAGDPSRGDLYARDARGAQ